ncbi:hypothetical protein OQA88_1617 [Cercophora sp. LCS_1]
MGDRLEKGSSAVRKRIEGHTFTDEGGEEYEASEFGGFGDYFRRKKIKLQNLDVELRAAAGEKPQIFKGIVAHVTGYTQPPLHVLHKELVQHGAGFLQYLDSKTMATHIIASTMPPKKALEFAKYRVVKPAWVTDSIEAGRLLPWTEYRIIDEGPRQKTIKFDGGKLTSQVTQQSPRGYREQTENSFYTSQFQKSSPHNLQKSSSPFQPASTRKSSLAVVDNIEEVDEMAIDLVGDLDAQETPSPALFATEGKSQRIIPQGDPGTPSKKAPVTMPRDWQGQDGSGKAETGGDIMAEKVLTSEEHNAMLLADPKIRKSSTANPDFLKQFYSESRLHHLSTWKAQLKVRLQKMAADKGPVPKGIRKKGSRRYIMHVDFDSFFCAVSLKKAPEFRDKPAVVAHSTGSGSEIASCNYPARKFGVKNGMWMKRALELCPDLKILPYDFPAYEEASERFYEAILDIGGVVQSVSIDEALIDVTNIILAGTGSEGVGVSEGSIWREQEEADKIASTLREQIKLKTECNVSVGIGGNVLLAKIALRKAKPAGQYQIRPEGVFDILDDLKVDDLPGVAFSISGKLDEIGIKFVKDIRQASKERLTSALGPRTGEKLWDYARGIDKTEVGEQPIRKSVSADVNWGIRFINQEEAEEFVRNLSKELERRLLNEGVKGKHLSMKIMRRALDAPLDPAKHLGHGKCDTFNKSVTFGVATYDGEVIGKEAVAILRSYKFSPGDLRGLGVQMTKLEPLKASTAGPDGSQKRLNFGAFVTAPKRQRSEHIDEIESPEKPKRAAQDSYEGDPITEDPVTPRKLKVHPALSLAKANAADEKATTPLNIAGTQFIVPGHPDPDVVHELPQDIRTKLFAQIRRKSAARSATASPTACRPQSPGLTDEIPSGFDPEVFNALPEEMKAEVLASYRQQRPRGSSQNKVTLTPGKDGFTAERARPKNTPTKGGIKDMFSRAKERETKKQDAQARSAQTSFGTDAGYSADESHDDVESIPDLDPEFLAELPESVRREVIEDHRRQKRAKAVAPIYSRLPSRHDTDEDETADAPETMDFPAPLPKIGFSYSGATEIADIKKMIKVWYDSSHSSGPHRKDVVILERYFEKVITEERNMEKVRLLMKWLTWMVDEGKDGKGKDVWKKAIGSIKLAVDEAMRKRGLGAMKYD